MPKCVWRNPTTPQCTEEEEEGREGDEGKDGQPDKEGVLPYVKKVEFLNTPSFLTATGIKEENEAETLQMAARLFFADLCGHVHPAS